MSKLIATTIAALSLTLPAAALACDHQKGEASAENCAGKAVQCNHENQAQPTQQREIQKLAVAQVVELKNARKAQIFDANSEQTRAKLGVVPGAVLLTSAGEYDVAKELPKAKDQKLVFYCMSEKCGASHMAAKRAVTAGYTDVAVMPQGITGWRANGQNVAIPQS